MPVNSELVARLLVPIREDAPAGDDLRYDARVDEIKEARREQLDLPTNNAEEKRKLADWPRVVQLTTTLLAEHTKDLQLAAWLTEALMHQDGYAGLATGLQVVGQLLDGYWDTIHPLPEDGDDDVRTGPLEWIGAKLPIPLRMVPFGASSLSVLAIDDARTIPTEREADQSGEKRVAREAAIAEGKPTPEAVEATIALLTKGALRSTLTDLAAVRAAIVTLDTITDTRFGGMAPSFVGLRGVVDEISRMATGLLNKRLEADPDPIADAPVEESAEAVSGDGNAISIDPVSHGDAMQRVASVARWLRLHEPASPAAYLLLRGVRWGEVRAGAPDVDPRLLEAPPTATRARLKALLLDERWTELLELAEQVMASPAGRGWLDLQRYVLTACANLGGTHEAIAGAIRSALRELLAALPQLSRMTLMDDTPTANEETRAWLEAEGVKPRAAETTDEHAAYGDAGDLDQDDAANSAADAAVDVLIDATEDDAGAAQQGGFSRARSPRRSAPRGRDAFELACAELAQNRPHRAIELLMAELARDQSARGRLVRQTQIAYVMVEAGLDAVAQPILQRVIETIDERQLEQWEAGPLVAQPMALMCRILDRTDGDESVRHELYLRVCRLDPLQALALRSR